MVTSALIKLPFILVALVGLQVSTTPPHPPPSEDETVPSTTFEGLVKQRTIPVIIKIVCYIAAFAEAAVILASVLPSSSPSEYVLSLFILRLDGGARLYASPSFLLGTALLAAAGFIRWKCYRALGHMFTFEMCIRKDHRLVTTGPYSVVRHPGYVGVIFMVAGLLFWHAGEGSWTRECGILETHAGHGAAIFFCGLMLMITLGLLMRMSNEDEALQSIFTKDWDVWAQDVPYRLIPGLY